jgi:hypothetical protein
LYLTPSSIKNLARESYGAKGKILKEDTEKTQTVFANTFNAEKKTDIAILKERRNILYEQLDALNEKYRKSAVKIK